MIETDYLVVGAGELRLSFSALGEDDLAEAGRRLAVAIRARVETSPAVP